MNLEDAVKLSRHVYFIGGLNDGRYPYSNSIFIDSGEGCLIDTGLGLNILNRIRDRVGIVFYTHWHEDHISWNKLFPRKYIHHMDKPAAEDKSIFCSRYPFPIKECTKIIDIFGLTFNKDGFQTFDDTHVFRCGDATLNIIYTSGHALGHSSFLLDDDSLILFLGDIDLSSFGPWYGGADSDLNQFIDSIKRIINLVEKKNINIAISSHTGVFRGKN